MIKYNIEIFVDKILIKRIHGKLYKIDVTNEVFFYVCKKYNIVNTSEVMSLGNLLVFELKNNEYKSFIRLFNKLRKSNSIIDRVQLGKGLVDIFYKGM